MKPEAFGIDVSRWNGPIGNLHPNVEFVISKSTEGVTVKDPVYPANKASFQRDIKLRDGVLLGRKRVWRANHVIVDTSSITNQLEAFNGYANLGPGDGATVDLEHSEALDALNRFGPDIAQRRVIQFGQALTEEHSLRPELYASRRSLEKLFGEREDFDKQRALWPLEKLKPFADVYDLWVVQYVDELQANTAWRTLEDRSPVHVGWWPGKVVMRQYTSSGDGRPLGVPDRTIDFDVCYDMDRLRANSIQPEPVVNALDSGSWWNEAQIRRSGHRVFESGKTLFLSPTEEVIADLKRNEPPLVQSNQPKE